MKDLYLTLSIFNLNKTIELFKYNKDIKVLLVGNKINMRYTERYKDYISYISSLISSLEDNYMILGNYDTNRFKVKAFLERNKESYEKIKNVGLMNGIENENAIKLIFNLLLSYKVLILLYMKGNLHKIEKIKIEYLISIVENIIYYYSKNTGYIKAEELYPYTKNRINLEINTMISKIA